MTWDCLVALIFGVILRNSVKKYASKNFLDSLTYSSLDQWDSVSEGIYLQKHGISAYDGDVVHQPPLLLLIWSYLLKLTNGDGTIYFLVLEFILLISMFIFCESMLNYFLSIQRRDKASVHDSSNHLLIKQTDLRKLQSLVMIWYALNPYSILVSAANSTIIVYNIVFLWINIAICRSHLLLAAILCSIGCYIRIYPGYLMFPILAAGYLQCTNQSKSILSRLFTLLLPLITFIGSSASLLWISYLVENHDWRFLSSVYWNTITVADCTPQMGIYWYIFVEMFDHFGEFFTWVFQLLIFSAVVGLTIKFNQNPLYICLVISFIINILQPYHNIGEFGLLISILPIWSHLLKQTQLLFISSSCLLTALILSPLFHYIWLQPGTGNANFYFAASLVHAFGQVILITDLLNAQGRYAFFLRHGPSLQLSNGERLKLIQE
ncbi:unnamed protein product [Schistosoma turkestanicum]|nr:unnamed protein product [Schistosoma turkestanicum]